MKYVKLFEEFVEILDEAKGERKNEIQRAKTHFKISDEEWSKLDHVEKEKYILKLPKRQNKNWNNG